MGDYSDRSIDKFRHAVRCFEADQKLWREGRTEELRRRVVGSIEEASENPGTDMSIGACRGRTPPEGRPR